MADNFYSVTLSDGTILSPLSLSGNTFRSSTPVNEQTFSGKLSRVVIVGEEPEDMPGFCGVHTNVKLVNVQHISGVPGIEDGYYFAFGGYSEAELAELRTEAKLEYIAMMTGVEL